MGKLDDDLSPVSTLELDLVLAGLIPVAAGAVAIAHRVRPRWVSSVRGGVRWRWLAGARWSSRPDPWVLLSIATLAVAACLANWRTGGLEAGIAMHAVNDVGVGIVTITYGGYAESFVSETTTGSPWDFFPGVVVHALAVALILWQARRLRIDRTTGPERVAAWSAGPPPLDPPDATWYAPLGR